MTTLKEDYIYFVDGGYFQAKFNLDRQQMELWTYEGNSGRVIERTGFEINPDGVLFDRIFDFETEDQYVLKVGNFSMKDLIEVGVEDFLIPPTDAHIVLSPNIIGSMTTHSRYTMKTRARGRKLV